MEYSKADRRAVIALAIVACCIVAGIVLFGQRELPKVQVPPIPDEFLKVFQVSKDYKDFKDHRSYESYRSYESNRSYKSNRSNRPYKSAEKSDYAGFSEPSRPSSHSSKFSQLTIVDINSADTTLLQCIPGIGSNIARWIVQRRERLGGFYTLEQLLEVKYVEPSMLKWFSVDTSQIHRVHICDMTFAEMSRHPYIGYEKAKAVSNFQRLYGPITDMEQLRTTTIFTDEELEKLQNYIF
jgi:DNA uptake protein ComE-like DNA-binding protein